MYYFLEEYKGKDLAYLSSLTDGTILYENSTKEGIRRLVKVASAINCVIAVPPTNMFFGFPSDFFNDALPGVHMRTVGNASMGTKGTWWVFLFSILPNGYDDNVVEQAVEVLEATNKEFTALEQRMKNKINNMSKDEKLALLMAIGER